MSRAYLSLGTNLGDRMSYLRQGIAGLDAAHGVKVVRLSSVYETEPVGLVDQPRYLNLVAAVWTELDPHALLATCQAVEKENGRERSIRWGPRTLDIDLLLYGDLEIDTPELVIPHPRMHERAFVLAPLMEVESEIVVAGKPIREWLELAQVEEGQGIDLVASTRGWIA